MYIHTQGDISHNVHVGTKIKTQARNGLHMPDWGLAPGKSKCSFSQRSPWGTMAGEMREREGQPGVRQARPPNQGRWGKSLLAQSKVQSVSGKTGLVRKE